ncbi:hypothetical protein PV11_07013 [Exophiala sideris]|uniref:DNA replication regulator Sld3 C-terminal domain-containing protein n=1 Tax=Exophiala sideris TaxID=1016849 RepID=A0A0D1WW99_9EURO|nr:hypothetical protein PV11_07013 [Exophiala sideris]
MYSPPQSDRPALNPTTDSRLNVTPQTPPNSRKRKSEDVYSEDTLSDAFDAHFFAAKSSSIAFVPVTLVARACLPLVWLDTSQALPWPVFEARITSVEEWEQRVLVVRKAPNGGLFAVERIGLNNYVACALHNWVTEETCKDAAIGKVADVKLEELLKKNDRPPVTHKRSVSGSILVAVPTPISPKRPTNRRGALARMSILTPKDPTDQNLLQIPSNSSDRLLPANSVPIVAKPLPVTPAAQVQNENPFDRTISASEAVLQVQNPAVFEAPVSTSNPCAPERLRNQYLEHLYTSRTSLAFYAKGPLSRARAHVRTAERSSEAISELQEFYEQSILPPKKIDVKYRESLPKVISELPVETEVIRQRKSRKRKPKLGKDCLWPEEEEYVLRWWRLRDLKPGTSLSGGHEDMRKEILDIRMRETKMQLLMILEVMLLELAVSKFPDRPLPADPDVKIESVEDGTAEILATTPHKSKRKQRNYSSELDTIVERLCIWHTVSLFETTIGGEPQNNNDTRPNDSLRDFCKDVLLPFYSAKLPEQVKSISRKLGGPETSPKRLRPPSKSASFTTSSSSAALVKPRPGQPLTKRTLERVLSEDQLGRHVSPPVLSRSSTVPMKAIVPTLKREPSERPNSRAGVLSKSVSFSNREIDLEADSKSYEAKRRKLDKLAEQKRELEAAIDALKRPSRTTVAATFMDEVENRRHERTVQISATPRARRIAEKFGWSEPELPPMPALIHQEPIAVIPSSTRKPPSRPGLPSSSSIPRASATKRAVLSAIHETPSRGLEKKTSDPLAVSRPQDNRYDEYSMIRSKRPVLFTPIKKSEVSVEDAFRDAPEIPERAGKMMDRVMGGRSRGLESGFEHHGDESNAPANMPKAVGTNVLLGDADVDNIYDELGWNDDFDL